MPKAGSKYGGLHKRDSYDGLIDYLEDKQEIIKYPDRDAKFVRDSPQYQQLLNEGFVEVEEQQLKQIKAEQETHAVIRTANDTNETAKEVKVVASQTDKQLITHTKTTGSQAQIPTTSTYTQSTPQVKTQTKSTYSQSAPQIFDMSVNDNMEKVKQDIDSVENTQQQNIQQQKQNITHILEKHLQHEATPDTTINFAHKMASSATSVLKKLGAQLASSSSQEPATSLLLGDPRGKQDWSTPFSTAPTLNLGGKPKLIPNLYNPKPEPKQTSMAMEIDDAVETSKPKPKPKAKSMTVDEQEMFNEIYANIQPKPKPKPKPKQKASAPSQTASSSQTPFAQTPVKKKTKQKAVTPLTTGTGIPPSKIGIQKLREELENAKNKGKLSVADTSSYMKMYDDWKGAKGDKALKDEKVKGLRDIYKRVLYNK